MGLKIGAQFAGVSVVADGLETLFEKSKTKKIPPSGKQFCTLLYPEGTVEAVLDYSALYGPFNSEAEAEAWGEQNCADGLYHVMEMNRL